MPEVVTRDQPEAAPDPPPPVVEQALEKERGELLERLQSWLETPMIVLAFVWLVLVIVELVWGATPVLEMLGHVIWGVFVFEFALNFTLAPRKLEFLQRNWLSAIALAAPALRIFRIARVLRVARAARATRGLRLVRVVSTINRSTRAFGKSLGRRGFGYVLGTTLIVTFVGAAGMYAFERPGADGRGLDSYGEALWWTAMIMTTMASEYWPQTAEGRVLCFILSLYAFAVFGYVTATLATYFIGRDVKGDDEQEHPGETSIAALRTEISSLRDEIRRLSQRLPGP